MALREFTDLDGRSWRAWDVRPNTLRSRARAFDGAANDDGWLAFEAGDDHEKRRLGPIPPSWVEATDEELALLLRAAAPVRMDSGRHLTCDERQAPRSELRTFRYPGGRYWTVRERPLRPRELGRTTDRTVVLRFSSGSRQLDLTASRDWTAWSDAELARLLHFALPRGGQDGNPTPFARRRGDRERDGTDG